MVRFDGEFRISVADGLTMRQGIFLLSLATFYRVSLTLVSIPNYLSSLPLYDHPFPISLTVLLRSLNSFFLPLPPVNDRFPFAILLVPYNEARFTYKLLFTYF